MNYNWQQKDWPEFTFHVEGIEELLLAIAEEIGHVSGVLTALPESIQTETLINIMVSEAVNTSAIEGEFLSRPDVMSSIKNKLGLSKENIPVHDKKAQGAGELMVTVRNTYAEPLSENMLFSWHKMLLGQSSRITVGAWRSHAEPMQVVSGAIGKEIVHFEAPHSSHVPAEMKKFIQWFNDTAPGGKREIKKAPIRSAIAHLYFETIHPFEDGNGRIGRAIAEKALSQTIGRPVVLSLSQAIEADKKGYYEALKAAQQKNDVTEWLSYFVHVIYKAQVSAKELVNFTLKKVKFLDYYKNKLNERQWKTVLRMLESPEGFEGGMTAKKYISITKTSKATATRDLQELVDLGAFAPEGGGRSVHYYVKLQ
jgi:Fic family protein